MYSYTPKLPSFTIQFQYTPQSSSVFQRKQSYSKRIIPTIIYTISGIALAPIMLAVFAMIKLRLGNNYVSSLGASLSVFLGNILQSFLYESYEIWRPTYWVLSIILIIILITLCIATFIELKLKPIKIMDYSIQKSDTFDQFDVSKRSQSDTKPLLNKRESIHFLCGITIQREYNGQLKDKIFKSLKMAFNNPWNWLLGIHSFAAKGIKLCFNGLWGISYMSVKFGYSRKLSATISGMCFVADAFTNLISGKLAAKYKKKKIFFVVCGFILLAPNYIIYCDENANMWVIILMNALIGVGTGISALPFALIREYNDCNQCSDIAGGLFNTIQCSSAFVLQWLVGILIDYQWEKRNGEMNDDNKRIYTVQDYNYAFVVIPICNAINIVIGLIVRETNAQTIQWDSKKGYFKRYFR